MFFHLLAFLNYLQQCAGISMEQEKAIARVLAECQNAMKQMKVCTLCIISIMLLLYILQDECSFVSLRDVERALLIFVYFFETFTKAFIVS